jgi:hypothetical protein
VWSGDAHRVYRTSSNEPSTTPGANTPWLVDLATRQQVSGPNPGDPVYDDAQQMTYMREPAYQPAIEADGGVSTKKADRETGEDQEGF